MPLQTIAITCCPGANEKRLPGYSARLGIADSSAGFVAQLREWLSDAARQLDERFPEKSDHVTVNKAGEFVVRRTTATVIPESAVALQKAIVKRMPCAICWTYSPISSTGHISHDTLVR
jgi:hypothetical protein